MEQHLHAALVVAAEQRDRADVLAKGMQAPFALLEEAQGNTGVVLHDAGAVLQEKVAGLGEGGAVQQV